MEEEKGKPQTLEKKQVANRANEDEDQSLKVSEQVKASKIAKEIENYFLKKLDFYLKIHEHLSK